MGSSSQLVRVISIPAVLVALYVLIRYLRTNKTIRRLPPGPKPVPFLGNVHQIPAEYHEKTFRDWGLKYGSIVFAKMFHRPLVILNSLEAAHDLLDKRSHNYSSRPRFVLLIEMLGWENNLAIGPYSPGWRLQRKWIQGALSKSRITEYHSILQERSCKLLLDIMAAPQKLEEHFARLNAAIVLEITYGYQISRADDGLVQLATQATLETASAGNAGGVIVDIFPFLRHYPAWLPGGGFKGNALRARQLIRRMIEEPYQTVNNQLARGVARSSITSNLIEEAERNGVLKDVGALIEGATAALFAGGTETTDTLFMVFILVMIRHPEVFTQAQNEIDRVVGNDRLPDLEDRESLPYLNAVISELYRFHPPLPLGIPHALNKDDEYKGYQIPGGSMVTPNIWAMSRNEEIYPDPEDFRPERFLEQKEREKNTTNPREFVFGFGRRICPGLWLAEDNIFLVTSRLIATMDIKKAKDAFGNNITPPCEFQSGFASRCKAFPYHIGPRSSRIMDMVSEAAGFS